MKGLVAAGIGMVVLAVAYVITAGGTPESHIIRVTVSDRKADGRDWDMRPGLWQNVTETTGVDVSDLPSRYPDLVLTVIAEDGSAQELVGETGEFGQQDSDCEDRLTCAWEVPSRAGYYAVVATDLDTGVSASGVFGTLKRFFTGEASTDTPLRSTLEFAGAAIVTDGWWGTHEDRVAALDTLVRNYLEERGATLRAADAIGVVKARDCREGCTLDLSGSAVLTIE